MSPQLYSTSQRTSQNQKAEGMDKECSHEPASTILQPTQKLVREMENNGSTETNARACSSKNGRVSSQNSRSS